MLKGLNPRTVMAAAHDLVAAVLAWCAAYLLRFNFDIPSAWSALMLRQLPWVVITQALVFQYFGLYRGIWRYASLRDLGRILSAVFIATGAITAGVFMMRTAVPRSVLILDPILLVLLMCGSRLAYRMRKERRLSVRLPPEREPVLVLGAGEAGANLVAELALSPRWRVVGLLDDDRRKHGRQIHGVSILGRLEDLARWRDELAVAKVIVALPGVSHQVRRRAVDICTAAGMEPMTVPSYDDLVSGKVTVSQIRRMEVDDLLGRDPIVLDSSGMLEWIRGRTVMITGAGGSIGSELCRQVVRFQPGLLVLFDMSEFALYQIEQELEAIAPGIRWIAAIGDVKNRARVSDLMARHRPFVVFHAAAYKHVPLLEQDNAWEGLTNNVLGTRSVAEAAVGNEVEKFVLISTDKAVNPTSVMGASKRLAELVCQSLQQPGGTRFVIVRFGNVLGSTGSVVPKFEAQIAAGGPVTVTHPEVRRFFMSVSEATQLVLQAGLMGRGGEIFVLDMGEPVKIDDLARDLIRLSGFTEDEVPIQYTGLRPGEKLNEELLATDESSMPTPHPRLRIAVAKRIQPGWFDMLDSWLNTSEQPSAAKIRRDLARCIPEYKPSFSVESTARPAARNPGATVTPLNRRG